MIWVLANIHFDDGLLPYFLRYYRQMGVDRFGIVYGDGRNPLLKDDDCVVQYSDIPYFDGHQDNVMTDLFRVRHVKDGDWYIPADLDEFHYREGMKSFQELIGDWDWVPSVFMDRIARSHRVELLNQSKSLDEQFPEFGAITKDLVRGSEHKCAFARGSVPLKSGHHDAHPYRPAPYNIWTHHFKWNSPGLWHVMAQKVLNPTAYRDGEVRSFYIHYAANGKFNIEFHEAAKIGV